DAAWSFVQYLTSEATQIKYSDSQTPIWTDAYTGDKLKQLENVQGGSVVIPIFNEQFQFATVRPRLPYYLEGSKTLQLALRQALPKQKTPQQAREEAAATGTKLGSK